jgi:alkanesulfonate monooxygenase SsuD/methylene tetrahydromethanopterin reductase-like flavin-dependent oxidoreductase (luciferase family)
MPVTLAAIFPPTQPPERIGAVATAADAAGLAQLWVWEDCFKESGIATATAMLAATSQVHVAIGLLPVPLRNVALTAMEVATLGRLFPGRLTAGVGPRTVSLAGELGDGVIIPGGVSPAEVRTAVGHFREGRAAGSGDVVVFVAVPADSPAADVAAVANEYASAGATHVAVNAVEDDADLVRFVRFLAAEVKPLLA